MAKKDRTGIRKPREHVVQILGEYMKPKQGRSIPRLMSRCMENSVKPAMKKRQFK